MYTFLRIQSANNPATKKREKKTEGEQAVKLSKQVNYIYKLDKLAGQEGKNNPKNKAPIGEKR